MRGERAIWYRLLLLLLLAGRQWGASAAAHTPSMALRRGRTTCRGQGGGGEGRLSKRSRRLGSSFISHNKQCVVQLLVMACLVDEPLFLQPQRPPKAPPPKRPHTQRPVPQPAWSPPPHRHTEQTHRPICQQRAWSISPYSCASFVSKYLLRLKSRATCRKPA